MKTLDVIVCLIYVVALVVLCFLQQCSLDIYFLIAGFAVAAITAIIWFIRRKKEKEDNK